MKVVITGGAGFLGTALSSALCERGHEVISVDGRESSVLGVTSVVAYTTAPNLEEHELLQGAEVWVNLAGTTIAGRWSEEKKDRIYSSRVEGTKNLVALWKSNQSSRPKRLVSASAVGVYGDRGDEILTEDSDIDPTAGFLAKVASAWEEAAEEAKELGVAVALVRQGHILGQGGLLDTLLPLYRFGLGGPLASGKQWFSWIDIRDVVALYVALVEGQYTGVVNAVAPEPLPEKIFSKFLAGVLKRPHFLSVPRWALQLRFRQFGSEISMSQRVKSTEIADICKPQHTNLLAVLADYTESST